MWPTGSERIAFVASATPLAEQWPEKRRVFDEFQLKSMTNAVHFNSFEVDLQLCVKHFQAETMCCDTFMESQVYEKDGSVQQKNLNYVYWPWIMDPKT